MRYGVLCSLFVVACASAPPPPPPPKLTEVPRAVLDTFCARLHDEGVSAETTLDVVTMTQPLITPNALNGLAVAAYYQLRFDPVAGDRPLTGEPQLPRSTERALCRRCDLGFLGDRLE